MNDLATTFEVGKVHSSFGLARLNFECQQNKLLGSDSESKVDFYTETLNNFTNSSEHDCLLLIEPATFELNWVKLFYH